MSKPVDKSYEFIWAKRITYTREQNLKCFREWQFAISFMHKEDYMQVGGSKAGIGL